MAHRLVVFGTQSHLPSENPFDFPAERERERYKDKERKRERESKPACMCPHGTSSRSSFCDTTTHEFCLNSGSFMN